MWKNRKIKMILTTHVCANNEAYQNYDMSHIRVANNHFSIISYLNGPPPSLFFNQAGEHLKSIYRIFYRTQ